MCLSDTSLFFVADRIIIVIFEKIKYFQLWKIRNMNTKVR